MSQELNSNIKSWSGEENGLNEESAKETESGQSTRKVLTMTFSLDRLLNVVD